MAVPDLKVVPLGPVVGVVVDLVLLVLVLRAQLVKV